ncbi:SIN3-HDAC complex-associated factor [Taenia crassiceps]|uniref:SIN3-HDAC complex-associated factor n=1 Tax=Taenia crassiceps TaxID=6207 RepID=A0ABR4Q3P4_9CEST
MCVRSGSLTAIRANHHINPCQSRDSLIKAMSGGGTGRGSGRAHFRSRLGCCICGTKSSSSRFTASERYAEHFGPCFGEAASRRCGDLCNACVLCVKRWIQRGRQPGYFSQVLDSKQGPGPKHMKEITKRARRREAKQQQMLQLQKQLLQQQQQHQLSTRVNSRSSSVTVGTDGCGGVGGTRSNSPASTGFRALHGHHHGHHLVHHSATCVACWADQNSGNTVTSTATVASTPAPVGGSAVIPPAAATSVVRTRSSVSRKLDSVTKGSGTIPNVDLAADFDAISNLAEISTSSSSSSLHYLQGRSDATSLLSMSLSRSGFGESNSSQISLCEGHSPAGLHHLHEHFRPPRPPQGGIILQGNGGCISGGISVNAIGGSGNGVGVLTRAAASASASNSGGFFDGASSTASSTTSTPSTPTRRHNRRTRLPPVKISSAGLEVHDILRKIQKDNNNMNLDNRQINMAMQREIRLRNRIINPPSVAFKGPQALMDATATSVSDRSAAAISATATGAASGNTAAPTNSCNPSTDLRV